MLRVSGKTEPKKLAGAILHGIRENGGSIELMTIGAGAVNQAVKGIAVARRIFDGNGNGREIKVIPGFVDVELDDRQVTGIKFSVFAD